MMSTVPKFSTRNGRGVSMSVLFQITQQLSRMCLQWCVRCCKSVYLIGVLLSGMLISPGAHAFLFGYCNSAPPSLISVPTITPVGDVQVGQIIGSPAGYAAGGTVMTCNYKEFLLYKPAVAQVQAVNAQATGHVYAGMTVYATNVPGVGYAMREEHWGAGAMSTSWMDVYRGKLFEKAPDAWGLRVRIFLVATGRISVGTVSQRHIGTFRMLHPKVPNVPTHDIYLQGFVVNPRRKPTCRVTTPSVAINMGTVAGTAFGGPGSLAGEGQGTLSLNCSGGTGENLIARITVTDQTRPANRATDLTLTPDSSAKGIALRLFYNNTAIAYGPDSAAPGNPNQWQLFSTSAVSDTPYNFVIRARYVQAGDSVVPGTANGRATFTMSYQ